MIKKIVILSFLFLIYSLFLIQKIDLTTADLGRHIKNGEMVLSKNFAVLHKNFYSYTQQDFPVINHHWLSGVIFYLIHQFLGLKGVHLFFIGLSLVTFFLFIFLAQKEAGLTISSLVAILILPLLGQRVEVRPEVFSYFFSGIFFLLLQEFKEKRASYLKLLFLPIVQILWVNLHIYFVLGIILIAFFLFEELWRNGLKKDFLKIFLILSLSMLSTLINPAGVKGALEPLKIFQNYGYLIVENQSVSFLERWGMKNPNFLLFKVVFIINLASFLILKNKRKNLSLINFFLAIFLGGISYLSIRNFTLFGFFSLPILATNLKKFSDEVKLEKQLLPFFVIMAMVIILFNFLINIQKLIFLTKNFGLGLVKKNSAAAEFFISRNLKGPIFNNYDIGSYLIFYLFPKQRVFVDNRPEAYSVDFFKKIYVPSQEKDDVWQKYDEKYNFNVIFFSHRDYTSWGQKFLFTRLADPKWAPVFVDGYAIIFLKRNKLNQSIIDLYQIPRERFTTVNFQ